VCKKTEAKKPVFLSLNFHILYNKFQLADIIIYGIINNGKGSIKALPIISNY